MPTDRLVLGTRKGVLIYERPNQQWQRTVEAHAGARGTYAMLDPRTNTLFACLDFGHWGSKLHRSDDFGRSWQELPAPKYPEGAVVREGKAAVLNYQWCLTPGAANQPGRLYMGTVPGGLFISDDLGASWQINEALWNYPGRGTQWFGGGMDDAGIHSILVDPTDPQRIAVGISCAGVVWTSDGGATWTFRNRGLKAEYLPNPDAEIGHDPHLVVQATHDPRWLWQQNHCGIFRSNNGGESWEAVSKAGATAHFGFAVAVDPRRGEVAWVVPAQSDEVRAAVDRKLCVCRTDDGGATWQEYRAGLPQTDCYDFAFRHGLDFCDDHLVVGTACGSLYLSEDRGETWQVLAKDLPPIYSARFL